MSVPPAETACPQPTFTFFVKDLASGHVCALDVPLGSTRLRLAVAALGGRQRAAEAGHVGALGEDQYLVIIFRGVRFGGVTEDWYASLDRALRDGTPFRDDEPHAASGEFAEGLILEGGVHLAVRTRAAPGRERAARAGRECAEARAEHAGRQRSCERVRAERDRLQSELGRAEEALARAADQLGRAAGRLARAEDELGRAEGELGRAEGAPPPAPGAPA